MRDEKKETWKELCELAANEQDGQKFYELVTEISRLLKEKEDRFKTSASQNQIRSEEDCKS